MSLVARPSDARRAALSEATKGMGERGVPLVSNFFPLERYFEAANRVLEAFGIAYKARRLDDAYVYGKRFAIFSLEALPQHNYYESPRYAATRKKNKQDMTAVIIRLEKVALLMDEEEKTKERERKRREDEARKREEEQIKREAEAARVRLMQFQVDVSKRNRDMKTFGKNIQHSALDKLKRMNGDKNETGESDHIKVEIKSSSSGKSLRSSGQRETRTRSSQSSHDRMEEYDENREHNHNSEGQRRKRATGRRSSSGFGVEGQEGRRKPDFLVTGSQPLPLPTPLPPPLEDESNTSENNTGMPPPPSYNTIMESSKRRDGGIQAVAKNNLSGLEQAAAISTAGGVSTRRPKPSLREPPSQRPMSGSVYANRELEKSRRMSQKKEKATMRTIKSQIRKDHQLLLNCNRTEVMNLSTHQGRIPQSTNGCAVISPLVVSRHLRSRSAVSDNEIAEVIDKQCGPLLREIRGKLKLGNAALIIPSDVHDHLVDKKLLGQDAFVGATGGNIMDRKHLTEFLRLLDSGEKNSHSRLRTGAALFFREHVVSLVKVPLGGKWRYDLIDSLPGSGGTATRTRCHDLVALETMLRYYASSRFSDSNCDYIDKNDWDDYMADFDPRVFQCFVWGDAVRKGGEGGE